MSTQNRIDALAAEFTNAAGALLKHKRLRGSFPIRPEVWGALSLIAESDKQVVFSPWTCETFVEWCAGPLPYVVMR